MKTSQLSTPSQNLPLAILLLAALLSMLSCGKKKEAAHLPEDKGDEDVAVEEKQERGHPRLLGRAPSFELTDQDGGSFSSKRLSGKPWVANFMFTRCPTTCPQQTAQLKLVQDRIKSGGDSDDLQLISFSVDPANDTAKVLKTYAESAGADAETWNFLTGTVEQIRDTISRAGFKLAVEVDEKNPEAITHSPMFVLVDAYQRIRGLYDSGGENVIDEMMADVAALEAEIINVPKDIHDPVWLKSRQQEQLDSADSIKAFHDFTFSDQREASGIQFMHKIVDDSGKHFKSDHYDHGNGVVVADVDGDSLLDIYFVNQTGGNQLWRNLGGGKFEDITESAGVAVSDRIGVSASFADVDNDGDPDLFVTALVRGNMLFENLGGGRFKDVTESSGLSYVGSSSGGVFFDYDHDGLVDLLVTNVGRYFTNKLAKVTMQGIRGDGEESYEYAVGFPDAFAGHLKPERQEFSKLYRNLGGLKFEDVSTVMGMDDNGWAGDAAPIDINSDGWTDLYVLNMQGDDSVFLNREGKKFERVSRKLFPKTPWGAMGIKAFDFENDGDLDIYIVDMHSDMSEQVGSEKEKAKSNMQWPASFLATEDSSIFGNAFFRQADDGSFEEVSDQIGAENYWPWGLSADDLNADGFDDVFVTSSMNFPLRYGVNSLLLNDQGERFRDAEFIVGVEPRSDGLAVPWFELDMAGADQGRPVLKFLEQAGADPESFPDRAVIWAAKGSRSSVIFDLDDDGDLDIVTNEMNYYPMVLLSNLSERKPDLAFLKVKLVGTKSNRSAFGAVVRLEAGDLKLMKVKDGQSGYLSHSDFPLYFGLGSAKKVDRLEVTWPSGIVQVVEGPIDVNKMLTVEESE